MYLTGRPKTLPHTESLRYGKDDLELKNIVVEQPMTATPAAHKSQVDGLTDAILGRSRTPSYGSCDDRTEVGQVPKGKVRGKVSRYQIGSEVLDFGESPVVWPSQTPGKLQHKPSRTLFSWLKFSDAHNNSEVIFTQPSSNLPPTTSTATVNHINDGAAQVSTAPFSEQVTETASIASPLTNLINRAALSKTPNSAARSVFSLFGIDRESAPVAHERSLELQKIKTEQKTLDLSIYHNHQIENRTSDLPAWIQTEQGPRQISLSKYLDEISKIGANGNSGRREQEQDEIN